MGIDERNVVPDQEVKSIGREETYPKDIIKIDVIKKELLSLATRVARRLRRKSYAGKVLTLKVKYHNFVQITRSITLKEATDDGKEIFRNCCALLKKTEAGERAVRLLGISLSTLEIPGENRQQYLFDEGVVFQTSEKVNRALDTIQEKFGEDAIVPGTLLKK